MSLIITSLLAGIFVMLSVLLSLQISILRTKLRVSFGDKNDETLRRRIRAHGNFIECAPMALISVALIEYGGGERTFVAGLACSFLVSRVLHAAGILYASTPSIRATGMLIQHATFLTAGFWLVYQNIA